MILAWNCDSSIINIVREPLAQIRNIAVPHLVGKGEELSSVGRSQRPPSKEFSQNGIPRRSMLKTDLHVIESGVHRKSSKLPGCVQGKAQRRRDQSIRSEKSTNAFTKHNIERLAVKRPPHIEAKHSAGGENSQHFFHTGGTVGKVLEPLLAEHDVEAAIGEGHISGTAEIPLYIGVGALEM